MSLPYLPATSAVPAAIAAAARFVEREYGATGYAMTMEYGATGYVVFRVRHFDGSEFRVMADRYENAWDLPDIADLGEAMKVGMAREKERRDAAFARIDARMER